MQTTNVEIQTSFAVAVVVQLLTCVWLFPTLWTTACQASLSFTISLSLLKFMSLELVLLSNHLILSCPSSDPTLNISQDQGFFLKCQLFASGGQSIRTSVPASVLPVNIQVWFPLGWTGWISMLSKGLSSLLQHHSLKASVLQCSAFFMIQLSQDYWKSHSFDYTNTCLQSDISIFF